MAVRASPSCRPLASAATVLGAVASLVVGAPAALGAQLRVTTFKDELIRHDGKCSLREAVAAANSPGPRTDCGRADHRSNTILLRSGRYRLTIAPSGRDDNTSGDLGLTGRVPVTLTGAGTRGTVVTARALADRVMTVAAGARLTLSRLTIAGGRPAGRAAGDTCAAGGAGAVGGGILNLGQLTLNTVLLTGNRAGPGGSGGNAGSSGCAGGNGGPGGNGGGVYNAGTLALIDSTVEANRAGPGGSGGVGTGNLFRAPGRGGSGGPGGSGGGIYSRGRLTVTDSSIYENRAGAGGAGGPGGGGPEGIQGAGGPGGFGGGIYSTEGRLRLTNSTLFGNSAGTGGPGGGPGGDGGAVAVSAGPSLIRNATVDGNQAGVGGPRDPRKGWPGPGGLGSALLVRSQRPVDDMRLQNTIVAASSAPACAGSGVSAIADGGHDLRHRAGGCPGRQGNPRLGPLRDYGGVTRTMALGRGSAAIGRVPRRGGHCPATDQRGVSRPEGKGCDAGAYEFALPKITILAPFHGASYQRGSRIRVRFRCGEGGVASAIATCQGSVARGRPIPTGRPGRMRFIVTASDRSGNRQRKAIHYSVWEYVNPLRRVSGLTPRRIDLGVDYAGWGPLLALGRARVTMASDSDSGPSSCWAISCWPGGGIVVYRLLDGPYAGKYVYVAEHITVAVRAGQKVRAGQRIATLYSGYPWSEWGWAAGPGPEALAMADGHRCTCSDPGGWSTIEGRTMNDLLTRLGAPSGYLQPGVPSQSMPPGWPHWSDRRR